MIRLLILCLAAPTLYAAEGLPEWERLLDEMLAAAERAPQTTQPRTPRPLGEEPLPPPVQQFLRYFSGRGRTNFEAAAARLAPYRAMIEETFDRYGVPREMLWLGLVESGFRPDARSPKEAAGMWQFIASTAERYGLTEAERFDPRKSTHAAARYLRFLFDTFGDWNLALAAYNAGENRVGDAMRRSGARDFWSVAPRLPRETQAYVPAVLAVQLLAGGRPSETAERAAAAAPVYAPITITP